MANAKKGKLWNRLKSRYKLSVQNETSYEEVFSMRLSRLHVLMALSMLSVILVSLTILLIAFTNLKEFIPGFPDGNIRHVITENALRVDSLETELKKRDRFLKSIQLA
ncbi:MAG: M23 family peptidase, partial [Odoribacter sp.]|nr:M23 family peptidase [Odoribacter sp.]